MESPHLILRERAFSDMPKAAVYEFKRGLNKLQCADPDVEWAADIFMGVLKDNPGFFECRMALRLAQSKVLPRTSFLERLFYWGYRWAMLVRAKIALMFEAPPVALALAEKVLTVSPNCAIAHDFVIRASQKHGMPRTAIASWLGCGKKNAKSAKTMLDTVKLLLQMDDQEQASLVMEDIIRHLPEHGLHAKEYNGFVALWALMTGSKPDQHTHQRARDTSFEKPRAATIAQLQRRLEEDPANLENARKLGDIYASARDFKSAMRYYSSANSDSLSSCSRLDDEFPEGI